MRVAIKALLSLSYDNRYEVAIQERWEDHPEAGWELHIFVRDPEKAGLLTCGLLANAIENINVHFLTIESRYNIGIREVADWKPSFKIW